MPSDRTGMHMVVALFAAVVFGWSAATQVPAAAPSPDAAPNGAAKSDPIKPIIDGMQNAQGHLSRKDSGAETRAIQERVVRDLQKLIDAAKQRSKNSGGRRNSGSQQKSSEQNGSPSPESQPAGGSPGPAANTGRGPGGNPDLGKRPETAKNPSSRRNPLLREVWGHLPPALRERVPADFSETILPAYDDVVRRYFEALLDESSSSAPGSSRGGMPATGPTRQ